LLCNLSRKRNRAIPNHRYKGCPASADYSTETPSQKIFSKTKKQKKKKAIQIGRTMVKPKGNGISPEGWQGNRLTR